jgi:hypothetical protein
MARRIDVRTTDRSSKSLKIDGMTSETPWKDGELNLNGAGLCSNTIRKYAIGSTNNYHNHRTVDDVIAAQFG